MGSRIRTFLILYKIITTIVAQEFQITVYNKPHFEGTATVLNVTNCWSTPLDQNVFVVASLNVSDACAILHSYNGKCSAEEFAIIPPNDPIAMDLIKSGLVGATLFAVSSISRCNYCSPTIPPRVKAYSFFVSDHQAVSGHHWLFNTAEFDKTLNKTNICGQIHDEFPIPFISVVSGCVQFYSSNDCTSAEPEINKFQSIHGVREWDEQKPVKSFSHCFLHCVPELDRNLVGLSPRYVEEEEPAFSGIRVSLASGLREDVYANDLYGRCHKAPGIDVSNVIRVVAKDICVVLYSNKYCNADRIVAKPTVLEAKGEKIAAIGVPDIFRKLPYVKAYMLCKALVKFEDYHLVLGKTHFFKDHSTTDTIRIFNSTHFEGFGQIINVSECSALPQPLTSLSSIESHGKCILLFVVNNCTGHYAKLEIGSPILEYMGLLDAIESYQSVQLCSNNRQLTTKVDHHYSFTLFQTSGSLTGYNWTFSSLANQSSMCWELPYYYRSSKYYPSVVVHNGCLKLFAGLKCSPYSQHFTITSSNKVGNLGLGDWGLKSAGLGSFTSCADLVKHPRIQSAILKQSLNYPYNYPNGIFYIMKSGEVLEKQRVKFCTLIPKGFRSKPGSNPVDEISSVYVNNLCIFVFDQQDCTMSENTTLPIVVNATDGPLERNLTENPFWGRPVSFLSTIDCGKFKGQYKDLQSIYILENLRKSAKNSTDIHTNGSTTSETIYIGLLATFGTLLVIGLAIVIYFKVTSRKNELCSVVELDVFYNGYDGPSTSNEDAIQNTAVNKALEIQSTNFTYVKSDDGSPIVLGSGCFGKVLRGILHTGFDELNNCELTRSIAIKTPKIGIMREQIRSLLCEIKICAFVEKHKNIVEFIGFCIEDIHLGKLSIVLELCENGSLLQFLRDHAKDFHKSCKIENVVQPTTEIRNRCRENIYSNDETFDYSRLLRWCQEIAEGMEFLSSKQVLHADLATRNCLLDSDLQIKITDFGLSRKLYDYGNYVKQSKAKLPWRWMALESLKNFTFSVKTDVWSYGVCLWEIFSFGDTPYPTLNWDDGFIENLSAGLRLTKPELCPEYCYQLMRKCWNDNPNERNDFMELQKAISVFRREAFGNNGVDESGLYTELD